jgi:hypothetical protein
VHQSEIPPRDSPKPLQAHGQRREKAEHGTPGEVAGDGDGAGSPDCPDSWGGRRGGCEAAGGRGKGEAATSSGGRRREDKATARDGGRRREGETTGWDNRGRRGRQFWDQNSDFGQKEQSLNRKAKKNYL